MKFKEFSNDQRLGEAIPALGSAVGAVGAAAGAAAKAAPGAATQVAPKPGAAPTTPDPKALAMAAMQAKERKDNITQSMKDIDTQIRDLQKQKADLQKELATIK